MSLFGKSGKAAVAKTDITKRFNLIGRVGQGSMSKVWRAEDKMSGAFVAVKVLDKEKTKRFEDRFKGLNKPNEADIAFSLRHPYIVKTLEVGRTLEDEMFLVMDYVEGSGLSLLIDLQSEELRRYRTRYIIQIGEALSYFHKQNWIHRDICPRNIMITDDHKVRLIDFGLTVPNTPDFQKPGNRTGTANYMAPELIKRRPTDQRIDVFAYAVTCYEMYAKRHPWDAALTLDAVMQHINQPPLPLLELIPNVDSQIAAAIMKGLEIDPVERWQTVDEMVIEFREAEVRLVKKTSDLLQKRKLRDADGNGASKAASDVSGKQRPDRTPAKKVAQKESASAKSGTTVNPSAVKSAVKQQPLDNDDHANDDASMTEESIKSPAAMEDTGGLSSAEILAVTGDAPLPADDQDAGPAIVDVDASDEDDILALPDDDEPIV